MQPPIRVLHVDDDASVLDLTATRLGREADDFEIVSRTSVAAAIDVLESTPIECIVSDYEMPDQDGSTFLDTVRRIDTELPFVLFTATERTELPDDLEGVTAHVWKGAPDRYAKLAARITAAVGTYRSADVSDRRLQMLAEQSNDVLWMFSADWDELVFINSAVEEMFGLTPEQLAREPRRFLEAIHPDDRPRVREAMARLSDGESASAEYRVNEDDDYGRWIWANAEPVTDASTGVERIVGFSRDITDRKQRERALAALNDVAVDLDSMESAEAVCERAIEASEAILNFDLSTIDLESDGYLSKVAISEDIPETEVTTMSTDAGIAGKTFRTGESMLIDDISNQPEAEPQGPFRSGISIPIGSHGVFQAVDEDMAAFSETDLELGELLVSHTASALDRLERERRLHRQNERLDEFSRIISHDLRNPLNVATGFLDLASDECESPHLDDAIAALERMDSIVEDTRMLAANGDVIDDFERVDVETLALTCWGTVPTDEASLEVVADGWIRADPDRLRHVFENLFRNAVTHGGEDVTVRVGECDEGFYVADDGAGIPEGEADSVMELGYSGGDGTGYGLAIVNRIAEAHGWTVHVVESERGGARFEFHGVVAE